MLKANPPRLTEQLTAVANCPHCGVNAPVLARVWTSSHQVPRADGQPASVWGAYRCTTCGHVVTAKGTPGDPVANSIIVAYFPAVWAPDDALPESVANYLRQARNTLANPDASVVMSAAAIDAILKDNKLSDGSLYTRIEKAVQEGLLTKRMAEWAHRVRLDANNPRHADAKSPHMSQDDARRAFDFAEALGAFLYVLPGRMPPSNEPEKTS